MPAKRVGTPVLLVEQDGVRIGVRRRDVRASLPVAAADWPRLARMARDGTFGRSGLPFARLASRLGMAGEGAAGDERPREAALLVVGRAGQPRCVLLLDGVPFAASARLKKLPVHSLPSLGVLADGSLALVADAPSAPRRPQARRDARYLLLRTAQGEACAVELTALRGLNTIAAEGDAGFHLRIGMGEGERVIEAREIIDLGARGPIERRGGQAWLRTGPGEYRVIAGAEGAARPPRLLLVAPEGAGRRRLRDLANGFGLDVSLADDARAPALAAARFDVVLFDLDAYAPPPLGRARTIGFTLRPGMRRPRGCDALVPLGDAVALLAALVEKPPLSAADAAGRDRGAHAWLRA